MEGEGDVFGKSTFLLNRATDALLQLESVRHLLDSIGMESVLILTDTKENGASITVDEAINVHGNLVLIECSK
tara:strand:+ start:720 stop:938 length:219 start_codon:yes stop_codon:yes gene_type:complete